MKYEILLLFILVNINHSAAFSFSSIPSSTKALPASLLCSNGLGMFKFDQKFPSKPKELSFCRQYREATCCNNSHAITIMRHASSYYEEDVSDTCKTMAVKLLCSPCDPFVGVNIRKGICQSACDSWYNACSNDMYAVNEFDHSLYPCDKNSVVCFPLHDVVNSGVSFCERIGLKVISKKREKKEMSKAEGWIIQETERRKKRKNHIQKENERNDYQKERSMQHQHENESENDHDHDSDYDSDYDNDNDTNENTNECFDGTVIPYPHRIDDDERNHNDFIPSIRFAVQFVFSVGMIVIVMITMYFAYRKFPERKKPITQEDIRRKRLQSLSSYASNKNVD